MDSTIRQLSVLTKDASTAAHPFSSPLLINHLSSLFLSVPVIEADTMLAPVHRRRNQLRQLSVPRLQSSAYRILATTFSVAFVGSGLSCLACIPPFAIIHSSAAIACGATAVLSSVLLGQRLWARAVQHFWRDWARVTMMLKTDLQVSLGVDPAEEIRHSACQQSIHKSWRSL